MSAPQRQEWHLRVHMSPQFGPNEHVQHIFITEREIIRSSTPSAVDLCHWRRVASVRCGPTYAAATGQAKGTASRARHRSGFEWHNNDIIIVQNMHALAVGHPGQYVNQTAAHLTTSHISKRCRAVVVQARVSPVATMTGAEVHNTDLLIIFPTSLGVAIAGECSV